MTKPKHIVGYAYKFQHQSQVLIYKGEVNGWHKYAKQEDGLYGSDWVEIRSEEQNNMEAVLGVNVSRNIHLVHPNSKEIIERDLSMGDAWAKLQGCDVDNTLMVELSCRECETSVVKAHESNRYSFYCTCCFEHGYLDDFDRQYYSPKYMMDQGEIVGPSVKMVVPTPAITSVVF